MRVEGQGGGGYGEGRRSLGPRPPDRPEVHLCPLPGGPGQPLVAAVGRQHQPEFFEAWLSNLALRNSISRTTFEVSFPVGGADLPRLGTSGGPMPIDAHPLIRARSSQMWPLSRTPTRPQAAPD